MLVRSIPSSLPNWRTEGAAATDSLAALTSAAGPTGASTSGNSVTGSGVGAGRAGAAALGFAVAVGEGVAPSDPDNETIRCPTLILSPFLTWILLTTPAAVEGMVATAF